MFMEFPRQEYWSELPFPPPEDLPDPGIEPESLGSPPLAGGFFTTKPLGKLMFLFKDTLFTTNYIVSSLTLSSWSAAV